MPDCGNSEDGFSTLLENKGLLTLHSVKPLRVLPAPNDCKTCTQTFYSELCSPTTHTHPIIF